MKLYQITNGLMELNLDEDISVEEKEKLFLELSKELKNKSANIIAYYENENALLDGVDSQIKRLQEYKKIITNRITRYKDYLKKNMEVLGMNKIETELGTISIAKCPISIDIVDENKIPSKYKNVVQTIKIDKKSIIDDFKETGEIIEGIKINTENKNLRIK